MRHALDTHLLVVTACLLLAACGDRTTLEQVHANRWSCPVI